MSLLTQSALLRALGWSLFNSLWQMSLLWASFHLFLLIFNRLPARSRHGLALLLLMVGTGWSALTFFQAYSFPETVPQGSQWLSSLLPAAAIGGALSLIGHWLVSVALPWGSSLYLIILSGLLMRYFRHYFQSRAITQTGLSKITPEFKVFTATTARRMGIRATVGVYLSSLVDVPVTLGFLKPVILLPVAMLTHLQTAQVEAILVHELAHIRRKDYLLNLMVTAIELLFFFNPFTRMLVGRLKKEREHCCDDQVLEFRYDPHAYVSALLSLARKNGREGLALAAIGGGDQLLLQRARTILQQKKQYDRPGPRALLFFLLLLLIGAGSLGISVTGASMTGTPGAGVPGDQISKIPPAKRLFIPVSMPATGIVRAPFVALATAEAGPVLTTPAKHHTPMHRASRQFPAVAEVNGYKALVIQTTGADTPPVLTELIITEKRDYSLGKTAGATTAPTAQAVSAEDDVPFVPNSSFSFQYTDTVSPKAKLVWMELMAEKEFRMQVLRLQEGLRLELAYLRDQQAQKAISVQMHTGGYPDGGSIMTKEELLKDFLQKQLQLQQEYQNRMDELQRQWLKMGHRLTIVYI
jgi:Zn-dependent protease with chaperone function